MPNSRIPSEPEAFTAYMQATDDYQLSDDPDNPPHKRYEKWHWTPAESGDWTKFRQQADTIFTQYNTPALVNTATRDKMNLLIRNVQDYDHNRDTGHGLLDLVAHYGNVDDWEIFNVKRATALQDASPTRSVSVGTLRPVITLRSSAPGQHVLTVNNPDTPDSHALPLHIVFAEVYRYINSSDNPPASLLSFEQIGVAHRGLFTSNFADQTFDRSKKYYAWYVVRYQSRDGALGLPSNELVALIDDTGHPVVN